jgi:hypothetical protein
MEATVAMEDSVQLATRVLKARPGPKRVAMAHTWTMEPRQSACCALLATFVTPQRLFVRQHGELAPLPAAQWDTTAPQAQARLFRHAHAAPTVRMRAFLPHRSAARALVDTTAHRLGL